MQIKNKERVKSLGEVFTADKEINAMLDMVEPISIDMTFLEPTCGNGNFVIEIYRRKFKLCKKKTDYIDALKSVVAIDIMADNIKECKERAKSLLKEFNQDIPKVDFILDTQIFQGNSLAVMALLSKNEKSINILLPRLYEKI